MSGSNEKFITAKDVEYVAKLARLALSEQEKESMQGQLERILGYVGKLKEVNTDRVAPTAHPYESTNVWREDVAKPFESLDEIFKNAPDMEEKYYKVKRVIE